MVVKDIGYPDLYRGTGWWLKILGTYTAFTGGLVVKVV